MDSMLVTCATSQEPMGPLKVERHGALCTSIYMFVTALVFLKRDMRKAAEDRAAGKEGDGAGNVLVNAAIDEYDRMDMADP